MSVYSPSIDHHQKLGKTCLSRGEHRSKPYTSREENYSAAKRSKLLIRGTAWLDLRSVSSEVRQFKMLNALCVLLLKSVRDKTMVTERRPGGCGGAEGC